MKQGERGKAAAAPPVEEPGTDEAAPKYEEPACAYCPPTVRACRHGEAAKKGPGFCPSKVDPEGLEQGWGGYADPFEQRVAQVSARVESEGYCRWTRVEEVCHFARSMGFKKVGIATCISFVDLAHTLSGILESHGLEVVSVGCKSGNVPKEMLGLDDDEKIRPGTFEPMCNPITQAELLNRAGCEFNIVLGLCVGHDSLFFRHSEGLATTLVAKDRVLAHNPVGALHLADTYYAGVWGPEREQKPRKLPKSARAKGRQAHGNQANGAGRK